MKRDFQVLICTVLLIAAFSSSAAAAGLYLGIHGGVGFLSETQASDTEGSFNFSHDAGFDGSITVGYDLGDKHPRIGKGRVELEFNSAANDLNEAEFIEGKVAVDGSVERTSIMLNTIGEHTTRSGMIIYVLLGLGWTQISLENVAILETPFVDDSSSQLAYQAGLGLGWRLSDHFVFDLGYRYFGATTPEFSQQDGTSLEYEYAGHRLLAGLRVNF